MLADATTAPVEDLDPFGAIAHSGLGVALRPKVAIAHDYLSERGGAERVVISLTRAFPSAPLYTSLYEQRFFPELRDVDVRPAGLNSISFLRTRHRIALPLLPTVYNRVQIDADVVLCSSSGWAHGVSTEAPKVVYCHNPPRWLYQRNEYSSSRRRYWLASAALSPYLRRWDQRVASEAERYIANSSSVARRIKETYHRDAEVLPPPTSFEAGGAKEPLEGVEPGFFVAVARLMPYKNVDAVVEAFAALPHERLVVVGDGPLLAHLRASSTKNVLFTGRVTDAQLRWIYANSSGLVSASYEDFGLTPVEAAMYGKPSALLRAGGFLDTTIEGVTGVFFDAPAPADIALAVRQLRNETWETLRIAASAQRYSEVGFARRMRQIIDEVTAA